MNCFVSAAPLSSSSSSSLLANRLNVRHCNSSFNRPIRRPRHTACLGSGTGDAEVLIIGAGLAGLSAGIRLQEAGVSFRILESSDDVGGRVRTDVVDGYTMDRGFQVFIEAYPKASKMLDYSQLDLQQMLPGAVVRYDDNFHVVSDPFRAPLLAIQGLFSPVGTLVDKLTVLKLRQHVLSYTPDDILRDLDSPEDAHAYLQKFGFSDSLIDKFFQPFYSGIFLAPLSQQRAEIMLYVLRMFSDGGISLPKKGIGAVPQQLARKLHKHSVVFNTKVTHVRPDKGSVTYTAADKETATLYPKSIIVATDGPTAAQLLGTPTERSLGSTCVYFSADDTPCDELNRPILALNGNVNDDGVVNNMFIPSNVCSDFAPPGKTLISTTVVSGDAGNDVEERVLRHMGEWFGKDQVDTWNWLKTYRVPHSQTAQNLSSNNTNTKCGSNVFVAGDHTNTPTTNGALVSGKLAAEDVLLHRQTN